MYWICYILNSTHENKPLFFNDTIKEHPLKWLRERRLEIATGRVDSTNEIILLSWKDISVEFPGGI